ncbi:MAG: hypothetical protein SGPRY_008254 [Prymnesium sp.]
MLTRNNDIERRIKAGREYADLLPPGVEAFSSELIERRAAASCLVGTPRASESGGASRFSQNGNANPGLANQGLAYIVPPSGANVKPSLSDKRPFKPPPSQGLTSNNPPGQTLAANPSPPQSQAPNPSPIQTMPPKPPPTQSLGASNPTSQSPGAQRVESARAAAPPQPSDSQRVSEFKPPLIQIEKPDDLESAIAALNLEKEKVSRSNYHATHSASTPSQHSP